MDEALALLRSDHPALRAARAELDAARAERVQAGLPLANPVLSGEAARHTLSGESDAFDRGVSLAQELEVGGQPGLRRAAADHLVARAEHTLADRQRLIEGTLRRAFAEAVAAGERVALAREAQDLAVRLARAAERRALRGDSSALDARLAELDETRAAQALASAETAEMSARASLTAAVGALFEASVVPLASAPDTSPPADVKTLLAAALARRPDLALLREERARAQAEARLADATGLVPNPTLRGFYRTESHSEQVVGGELSIPIPLLNRGQGTRAALYAAERRAAAEQRGLERVIPLEVHTAAERVRAALHTWTLVDASSETSRAAGEMIRQAFDAGYLAVPDALMRLDRLLLARAALVDARLELARARADLSEATGGTTP
jgi:cobalt-zinc-cadmium efflux system outer membrane protein